MLSFNPLNWFKTTKEVELDKINKLPPGYAKELALIDYEYNQLPFKNEADAIKYKQSILFLQKQYNMITHNEFMYKRTQIEHEYGHTSDYTLAKTQIVYSDNSDEIKAYSLVELDKQFNYIDDDTYKLSTLKLDLEYGKIDELTYEKTKLDLTVTDEKLKAIAIAKLNFKFSLIGEYERDMIIASLDDNPEFAKLDVEYAHKRIGDQEYELKKASLENKPFGRIIAEYTSAQTMKFDVICNKEMIEQLTKEGHSGSSDEDIINSWVEATCRSYIGYELYKDII